MFCADLLEEIQELFLGLIGETEERNGEKNIISFLPMTGSRQPPTNAVPNQSDSHIEGIIDF